MALSIISGMSKIAAFAVVQSYSQLLPKTAKSLASMRGRKTIDRKECDAALLGAMSHIEIDCVSIRKRIDTTPPIRVTSLNNQYHSRKNPMKNRLCVLFFLLIALPFGYAEAKPSREFTLEDVQGFWWEKCDDPAAQFAIQQGRYFGDFEGEFKVTVEGGILMIEQGSEPALRFRILAASPKRLVLRMASDSTASNWVLRACADTSGHRG